MVQRLFLLSILGIAVSAARADYGIVPPFQTLYVMGGVDYLASAQHYDTNGQRQDVTYSGSRSNIGQWSLWAEGEYGIAKDYSLRTRFSFVTATSKNASDNVNASGSGLGDTLLGLKWRTFNGHPGLTLELLSRIPFYSSTAASATDLVVGNGSVDVAFLAHLITKSGNVFFFLTPGFQLRTNGYASQFLLDAAVEVKFGSAFARGFYSGAFSTGDVLRNDASFTNRNSLGAAGNYLRLSGSPSSMVLGAKLGLRFSSNYFVQLLATTTIAGTRAPAYFQGGFSVGGRFDFFDPPQPKKVHEVPLDGDASEAL